MSQQNQQEVSCGLDYYCVPDIRTCYTDAMQNKYKFLALPVVHPRFRRPHLNGESVISGFTRSDLLLESNDWSVRVISKLSSYLDVDSPSPIVRQRHQDCMNEELNYCTSLNVPAIMLTLKNRQNINLARILQNFFLSSHNSPPIWVQTPMLLEHEQNYETPNDVNDERNYDKAWLMWSQFHERLEFDKRVHVALEIPADLPSMNIISRWLGEPIKCIVLPMHIFNVNKKGLPVLSPPHQRIVRLFIQRDVQILISGSRKGPIVQYPSYIEYLWEKRPNLPTDPVFQNAKGYEDFPQIPLQPLADNLETTTYNVFEKDPVKYDLYQRAIVQALTDLKAINEKPSSNNEIGDGENNKKQVYTVMVLGAGRGPLVWATINAAEITNTKLQIFAVEKNPGAVVTLEAQAREVWRGKNVSVMAGDMRRVHFDSKADIIVSELLGSWSDNELSPECLDGAMRLLKPGGICIPTRYTSYAAPMTSSRLWATTRAVITPQQTINNPHKDHETLWVVFMQNKYDIAENVPVFTFEHPSRGSFDADGKENKTHDGSPLPDNRRNTIITWTADQDAIIHGFAGYFDCLLYGDVTMSIVPETHTPDMISWFPVFIPIRTPLRVQKGELITAWFWRCVSTRKVWYEWIAQVGNRTTPLHNPNGRSYEMLL